MKKVTLANEKGGVGKTTLAVNIAAGLALRGKRVLLIDADAQANSTDNLGLEPYPGFYDWLVRGAAPEKVIASIHPAVYGCESDVPPLTPHELASLDEHDQAARLHQRGLETSRLHLLGSNVETYMIASAIREEGLFARRLDELADRYDYAVIDTAPTPSLLHAEIYRGTQYILYPTLCETLSLKGLEDSVSRLRGIRRLNGKPVEVIGVVPNQYRGNTLEHQENLAELRRWVGTEMVWPVLPQAIVWAETTKYKIPIFVHVPGHDATLAFYEVLDRVEEATRNGN